MIRIIDLKKTDIRECLKRNSLFREDIENSVREILAGVQKGGDQAVREYTEKFDHVHLDHFEVDESEISEAVTSVDPAFMNILREAAENIRKFHQHQVQTGFIDVSEPGKILGQRFIPLEKVGIYVPGGTAAYPSSVLMNAVPAKLAGVREIVMVTPPGKDGKIPSTILAAAKIAGIDRIFKVGGAQAIGALTYGTESIPKVYKIVGPGNVFVATAKRMVLGLVGIDMFAGPSEILVIADGKTDPQIAAADLLSQAEHDINASAMLITDSPELAQSVSEELEKQIPLLPRAEICRKSVDNNGRIFLVKDLHQAVETANLIAPEHLELCVDDPFLLFPEVTNAGSVFLGRNTPEALGDYFAGSNHVLPTSGTAHFSSPLSVDDFVKKSQFICYSRDALSGVQKQISLFAEQEGLHAHARSVEIRFPDQSKEDL